MDDRKLKMRAVVRLDRINKTLVCCAICVFVSKEYVVCRATATGPDPGGSCGNSLL